MKESLLHNKFDTTVTIERILCSDEKDVTLLVTTHHMGKATRCDSVDVLNRGRTLAEGAADELLW